MWTGRLSQLLDSDVKEPEDNNSLVDSITPWVVKVVPAGVCLILLVAGGVVIAKRLRRGEKGKDYVTSCNGVRHCSHLGWSRTTLMSVPLTSCLDLLTQILGIMCC